jgi:type IV secretory pathway component VirB8
MDLMERSNRRLSVMVLALSLAVMSTVAGVVVLALRQRPSYVVAVMPNGQEYIVTNPKAALSLPDAVLYEQARQDLRTMAESCFERSAVTAQRDAETCQWFLDDDARTAYNKEANGPQGWVKQVATHVVPEAHVYVNNVVVRKEDIQKPPYRATIYFTRTSGDGTATHWLAPVTFVVRPDLAAKLPRMPLQNALGVFAVKPLEAEQDYRQ